MEDIILEVKNLRTYFELDEGTVRAVDGVDFTVKRGITLGIVGESGCGKSSLIKLLERFYDPTEGSVRLDGVRLSSIGVG